MKSYDSFNDYNSYTSYFKSPYNFRSGGVNSDVSKLWLKRLQENRRAEELRMQANNRSNWDRAFDALSSVNYGVAGIASGLVDMAQGDKGASIGRALQQGKEGFTHGINIFSNDTSDKNEYTFSRVLGNAGWKPTSLAGKITKGVLGFGLDVALDPTTYMTFGVGALLKGTGKAGKAVQKLAKVVEDLPEIRFDNKMDELIKKGVNPDLAERVAMKRYDADKAAGIGKVTHMTDDIASEFVKKHYREIGKVASKEEIATQSQKFASEFNRLAGARTEKGAGISFGIKNAPFGDKLAPKMGKFGKTFTILDNDDFMRAFSDKMKISHVYAKARDAVYGSQIGKLFSTNHPIYKMAVKNPQELFKFVEFIDYAKGLKGNKVQAEKMIRDQAKVMNMDLSPAEMKEVINIMEDKTVQGKIKKVINFANTKKAQQIKTVLTQSAPKMQDEIDDLVSKRETVLQMKKASEDGLAGAKDSYDAIQKEYHEQLASIDVDKITDINKLKTLVDAYKVESAKLEKQLSDTNQLHQVNVSHFEELHKNALAELEARQAKFAESKAKANPQPEGEVKGEKKPKKKTVRAPKEEGKSERTLADAIDEKYEAMVKEIYNDKSLNNKERSFKMKQLEKAREVETRMAHERYKESSFDATTESLQKFLNTSEEGEIGLEKYDNVAQEVASEKLRNEFSTYIYGSPGKMADNVSVKNMEKLLNELKKGASPRDLENFIDENPHLYSEHHLEVYKYLAQKYRYATWKEAYTDKMQPIDDKLRKGEALTPVEERNKMSLLSLKASRDADMRRLLHKMSYDEFKAYRLERANDPEVGAMFDEVDLNNKRSSALNSKSAQNDEWRKVDHRDDIEKGIEERQGEITTVSSREMDAMLDDVTAIFGGKLLTQGKNLDSKAYSKMIQIRDTMAHIMNRDMKVYKYSDLNPQKRHSLFKEAVAEIAGIKKSQIDKKTADALVKESYRRVSQGKLNAILDTTKPGHLVTFISDEKPLVGKVVKMESSTQGTVYTVERKGGTERVLARDVQANHGYPKGAITAEEKVYLAPVSAQNLQRKAELQDNIAKLDERIKEVDELYAYKRESANRFYQSRLNQAQKNVEDYEKQFELHETTYQSLDDEHLDALQKQLKEIELAIRTDDALELWARMHNEHDLQNLADPNRWNHVVKNAQPHPASPNAKAYAENGKIHITGKVDGKHINKRFAYFKDQMEKQGFDAKTIKEIFNDPKRFDQYLLEHEQSHIKNKDTGGNWGEAKHDQTELRADIDAFNMIKSFDPDAIVQSETFLTKSAKEHLSNVASNDKVAKYVEMLTKQFSDMGREEVGIGKLSKEQFLNMVNHYVPHIPTEDGARFIENSKEMKDFNARVTQELGYGQKWNPYAKERTIQGKNIEEINQFFDAKLKGKNLFSENVADIFLTRALKHEELMYDDSYMRHMMDVFGTSMHAGDEIEKGYKAVVNYGHLRETIRRQVNDMVKNAKRKGANVDASMFDTFTDQVIRSMGLPKGILDEFATPMVELTQDQVNKIAPHGVVKSVNDAIVGKANQARKLQIAKDQSNFLKMYDRFLYLIKLNQTTVLPAFHIRNKLSNLYLGWLGVGRDAVNPRMQADAFRTVKHQGDIEKLKDLRPITIKNADGEVIGVKHWNEIYEEALAHGVVDEGFFATEFGAHAKYGGITKGKAKVSIKGKEFNLDPTDTEHFFAYKYGAKVGSHIENSDRLLQFASRLSKGQTAEVASEGVKKFLFDYSDLTAFEQSVMKRIFPYYTWLRKNGRLQASQLLEQPGKYRDTAKAMHAVSDMNNEDERVDRRMMAPFAQDWVQTPFGKEGEPIMLNPNLPFQDLNNLPNPTDLKGTAMNLLGKTSPILKAPAELATNTNVFYDAPISEEGSKNPVGDRLQHLVNQTGWGAAVDGYNDKATGTGKALQALSTLGGIKATNYNEEVMQGHLKDDKKVKYGDENNEPLTTGAGNVARALGKHFKVLAHEGLKKISPAEPKNASQYTGALRPISATSYNELSDEQKKLYTPPTKKDATAYSKKAQELEKEAYKKSGKVKKFLWTLLDATDMTKDNKPQVGRVVKVIDGDTFVVRIGDKEKKVRMLLMDTPETVKPNTPEMPEGKKASNYSKHRLTDKDVKLVYEGGKTDYYGRNVAYISVDDTDYNKELIEKGLAKVRFTHQDLNKLNPKYSKTKEYFEAEKKASKKKKGIHQDKYKGYVTPGKDEDYNMSAVERYLKKRE